MAQTSQARRHTAGRKRGARSQAVPLQARTRPDHGEERDTEPEWGRGADSHQPDAGVEKGIIIIHHGRAPTRPSNLLVRQVGWAAQGRPWRVWDGGAQAPTAPSQPRSPPHVLSWRPQ